jgi:hypothetical protein
LPDVQVSVDVFPVFANYAAGHVSPRNTSFASPYFLEGLLWSKGVVVVGVDLSSLFTTRPSPAEFLVKSGHWQAPVLQRWAQWVSPPFIATRRRV